MDQLRASVTLTNPAQIGVDKQEFSRFNPGGLERLAEAAVAFAEAALAPATLRAYQADWDCFTRWCGRNGFNPLPALPETVALYIAELAGVKATGTIRRRLTTISQAHAHAGHDSPTRTAVVTKTWKGILRTFGSTAKGKAPARTATVRAMVATLDGDRLIGARDRALLVLGFAGALRRSELVALDTTDIATVTDGLEVTIRRSKTDQEGEGAKLGLPFGSDPLTCPVRAYRAWLDASGVQGAIFRPVTKGGVLGVQRLSARAVADVVKRTAERAGFDPAPLAGHSLRSGLITSAAEAGVLERDIMRHSRHKSIPVMRRYIRDATLFQDNAAAKVGL